MLIIISNNNTNNTVRNYIINIYQENKIQVVTLYPPYKRFRPRNLERLVLAHLTRFMSNDLGLFKV